MNPALRTPAYIRTPCYKGQLFFSQALTFKPLNTDTPTLFMAHSGSVLRLLAGFDCEGKTWLRDTSYVCRKQLKNKGKVQLGNPKGGRGRLPERLLTRAFYYKV